MLCDLRGVEQKEVEEFRHKGEENYWSKEHYQGEKTQDHLQEMHFILKNGGNLNIQSPL